MGSDLGHLLLPDPGPRPTDCPQSAEPRGTPRGPCILCAYRRCNNSLPPHVGDASCPAPVEPPHIGPLALLDIDACTTSHDVSNGYDRSYTASRLILSDGFDAEERTSLTRQRLELCGGSHKSVITENGLDPVVGNLFFQPPPLSPSRSTDNHRYHCDPACTVEQFARSRSVRLLTLA